MPTLKKALPKHRKHRASGQAVVTICGRDHYLGKYDSESSRSLYDKLTAQWVAEGRPRVSVPRNPSICVKELILAYCQYAEAYYVKDGEPTNEQTCIRTALKPVRKLYGDCPVTDFTPLALKACREEMIATGWCRRHINKQVCRIRQMFKWGVAEGMVPVVIHQALQALGGLKRGRTRAIDRPRILPVADTVIEATLGELDSTLRAMVQVQRLTGMRPQEVCLLTPEQIDRTGEIWLYRPARHKSEHHDMNRVVPIGPKAQAILLPYLLRGSDEYCFQPARSHRQHYTKDSYRERIQKACRRAFPAPKELDADERKAWEKSHRWAPNQLRHTAGTEIRAKFGLEAAQVVLGHSKASTTEIYAERDLRLAVQVAREVG